MELRDVRRWLGEKFVHHWGEQLRMQRAAAARGFGLPGAEFALPDMGAQVSMTSHTTATMAQTASVGKWLIALAIILAFMLGLILVAVFWGNGKPPSAPAQPPASKQAVDPIELELQWWTDEDGKMHFGQPTPVAPKK